MATTYHKHDAIKAMIAHRFDPGQAEGIARAIAGLAGACPDYGDLVTKEDLRAALDELRRELRSGLATKAELRAEIAGLEARMLRWFIGMVAVQIAGVIAILVRLSL